MSTLLQVRLRLYQKFVHLVYLPDHLLTWKHPLITFTFTTLSLSSHPHLINPGIEGGGWPGGVTDGVALVC